MTEKILILDFGSQYTQLIARRVRELNVYCEIYPYNHFPKPDKSVKGVILSGSPFSIRDNEAPIPDLVDIKGVLPLLGVCYGAQYFAHYYGGEVLPSEAREYGRANLKVVDNESGLDNLTAFMAAPQLGQASPSLAAVISVTTSAIKSRP